MTPIAGIGVDAVDVERFEQILARRPKVADRLFSAAEQAEALSLGHSGQSLAVRFAAKEATLKALGLAMFACSWHDIELARPDGRGAPTVTLRGAARRLADQRGVKQMHVSLTHTDLTAIAMVVAEAGA